MDQKTTLKIGLSGVRGIVGESFTPQLITSFASAFGTFCGPRRVVIGTDTRPSREMVTNAAIAGLLSVGCTPVKLGVTPVPSLQHHIRKLGAGGGICVMASDHPLEWSALKFFNSDGTGLRSNQFVQLTDLYHQGVYPRVPWHGISDIVKDDSATDSHFETVLNTVDVGKIRSRRFKVAIDCCNDSAFRAGPEFLKQLGCEVHELNTDADKPFPRDPEPAPSSLGALCATVRNAGADLGFALDADGDRLGLVDEQGFALDEDCTLALVLQHRLAITPSGVVVSVSTSSMVEEIAKGFGCSVFRTKVGEVYVLENMLETRSRFGSGGNGGVIDLAVNPCHDGFVAMAYLLEGLSKQATSLGTLRSRLPRRAIIKKVVPASPREIPPFLRLIQHLYKDQEMDLTDGVRVLWPDRWLLARGSKTEPVLRIVAEASTEADANDLVGSVTEYLRPLAKGS